MESHKTTTTSKRGLISFEGAVAPHVQLITPQHIGFLSYLIEKTRNMQEYYLVSLESNRRGILSDFGSLYEKFRCLVILLKLSIEHSTMIRHV